MVFKKFSRELIPLRCLFELTFRCNLSCTHCYISSNKRKELTTNEILEILNHLKEAGCLYLTFSGGEILFREDFFEIAKYARSLNFALRLFTNGTLIDHKVADNIKAIKPLSVEISLYGLSHIHDTITRVRGSFEKSVYAVKLLKKRGIKVVCKSLLIRQNVSEIWRLRKFVIEKLKAGWRGVGVLLSPCDNGNRTPLAYRLDDHQLHNYFYDELRMLRYLRKGVIPRKITAHERICGSGLISFNITPYGELNPCVQIRLKNNNVIDRPFMEIWKGHPEIQRIRQLRMRDRRECHDCEYISYCFSCPGLVYLERGSYTAKLPEACRQAAIRKEVYEEIPPPPVKKKSALRAETLHERS